MCKCECGCFLCCPTDDIISDLRDSKLSNKVLLQVSGARSFALSFAQSLEPEHISSWPMLIALIEAKLELAKQEMKLEKELCRLTR